MNVKPNFLIAFLLVAAIVWLPTGPTLAAAQDAHVPINSDHKQLIVSSGDMTTHCNADLDDLDKNQPANHDSCDLQCCSSCASSYTISTASKIKAISGTSNLSGSCLSPVLGYELELLERPPRLLV